MPSPLTSPKENRAPFDAQQIDEMFRAFQASLNADLCTNEECVHDREMSYLDRFMKNKPLKFWGAPEAEKAKSEADLWWGTIRAQYNIEEMKFDNFEQLFLKCYFLDAMKHTKIQEFLDLKQGNMTVAEYVTKFIKLSQGPKTYHEIVEVAYELEQNYLFTQNNQNMYKGLGSRKMTKNSMRTNKGAVVAVVDMV
ncbi:hypothetical protein COP1_022901 [Malus domestica]